MNTIDRYRAPKGIQVTLAPIVCKHPFSQIMVRIKQLCYKEAKPDAMNQQLLRNMRVYEVVLEFLSIPYDKVR